MQTLLVASRKGLLVLRGAGAAWSLTAHHFAGDPVTQAMTDPRTGHWYAALRLGHFGAKLRKSTDQGRNWCDIATPAFPPKPQSGPLANDPTPWNVELVWSLTPGAATTPGTLWVGCMPAGLFKSEDGGQSWALCRALWEDPRRLQWMGGGNDYPGMHSVLVDPRDPQHIRVAISCGGVWQTRDAGASWALMADGMVADYLPAGSAQDPNTQDPHRMLQCAAHPDVLWVQHHCGMYRSTDGGRLWTGLVPPVPSAFGFAVACDPQDPLRAWFVPAQSDTHRYPVGARMVVTRTDDGGKSFTLLHQGLPQSDAYHLVYRHGLELAPDRQTLAMASTTGGLWISPDAGEQWHCISRDLPPVAALAWERT
ncbi:sialidase [Rhodoferax lacus]|uniref:Sialidase n=1 Tax=Rhodoferax lacus TaxID=2184758 RepID=A0A3E1RDY3_9BURK|nr:sialidase family protein [Rhodoferax lacus]RFO97577.1 sialidase [Rhodoferax lacus]